MNGTVINEIFQKFDLIVGPTMPTVAFKAEDLVPEGWGGDEFDWTPFTYPFNMTCHPAATINCGFSNDLPIGFKIIATKGTANHLSKNNIEVKKIIKRIKNHTDLPICSGFGIKSPEDAKKIAEELSYPVIIRVAYTLGGRGGGIAHNEIELHEILSLIHI